MKDADRQRSDLNAGGLSRDHKIAHMQKLVTEGLKSGLSDASPDDIRKRVKKRLLAKRAL